MKKTLFFFTFLLSTATFAQVPNSEDSLATFLKIHSKDTLYILAMRRYALIQINEKGNNAKADSLVNELLNLSEKLNFGRGLYNGY